MVWWRLIMAERTQRGEEDQKRQEQAVRGTPTHPVGKNPNAKGSQPTTTRDKGVEPAKDKPNREDGDVTRDDLGENA
jgi:hypothetical protein